MIASRTVLLLGSASVMLAVAGVIVLSRLSGPAVKDVRVGTVVGPSETFTVKGPGGWLAGIALTTTNDISTCTGRVEILITENINVVAIGGCDIKTLQSGNWVRGSSYNIPLEFKVAGRDFYRDTKGRTFKVALQAAEAKGWVIWGRFVDDRLFKSERPGRQVIE